MKRIAAILALTAMAALLTGSPAHAEEGPGLATYAASADSRALLLSVLGQSLTVGGSHAELDSTLKAASSGTGLATPVLKAGDASATTAGDGTTNGSADPTCEDAALPELPLVSLDLACGTAIASVTGGKAQALGAGKVASVGVGVAGLIASTPLSDVADNLQTTVDGLLGQLAPVFDAVGQTGLDADSLVADLLDAIVDGGELVHVNLGDATSKVEVTDTQVIASSTAQAGTIKVLDRSLLSLPPVLTITIGSAGTSVARNRATGAAEPTFDPAIVTVDIAPDIAALLPEGVPSHIPVAPGQDVCIPLPPPLDSCIKAGAGSTTTKDDGTIVANASGVRLDLLKGLPDGGIILALADAQSQVGATLAVAGNVVPPAVEIPLGSLPRTGADSTLSLVLAAALAAAAALGLSASRRARLSR